MCISVKEKLWRDIQNCLDLNPAFYREPAQRAVVRIDITHANLKEMLIQLDEYFSCSRTPIGSQSSTFVVPCYIRHRNNKYTVVYLAGEIRLGKVYIHYRIIFTVDNVISNKNLDNLMGYPVKVTGILSDLKSTFNENNAIARLSKGTTERDLTIRVNTNYKSVQTFSSIVGSIYKIAEGNSASGVGYTVIDIERTAQFWKVRILRLPKATTSEKMYDIIIL